MFKIIGERKEFADKVEAANKYRNMKFILTDYTSDGQGHIQGYVYAICDIDGDEELSRLYVEMSDNGRDCILCGHYDLEGFLNV